MRGAACNQARYFQARVARLAPRACARHSPANRSRSADKRQAQAARQAAQRKLAESGGVYDAAPWATDREKNMRAIQAPVLDHLFDDLHGIVRNDADIVQCMGIDPLQ